MTIRFRARPGAAGADAGRELLPPPAREVRPPGLLRASPAGPALRRAPLVSPGRVLLELRIENLLLIERAELRLGAGPERDHRRDRRRQDRARARARPAAGRQAALGDRAAGRRARPTWRACSSCRRGCSTSPSWPTCASGCDEDADEIVLARRVGAEGRTRAFVQGRSATAADLRALGGRLVAFFGQHEHRRLTLASAQLELLDGFCGREQLALRERARRARTRACASSRRELAELRERAGTRDRDLDLLAFEIEEIEALGPTRGGAARRSRRARAAAPDRRPAGRRRRRGRGDRARRRRGRAWRSCSPRPSAWPARCRAPTRSSTRSPSGCARCGSRPRTWAPSCAATRESLEAEPGRLEEVEERLEPTTGSSASTAAASRRCSRTPSAAAPSASGSSSAEVATERAEAELAEARAERATSWRRELSARAARGGAAAGRAGARGAGRAGDGGRLVRGRAASRARSSAPSGAERVELMLAPNPGVPAAPLREAASGGELSRVMLALMTVAGAGESRTLVFDEVDAGVGGQTARAVGERLRALGERARCSASPTCRRSRRWRAATSGSRSRAAERRRADDASRRSSGDGVVEELCRMLGAEASDDGAARRHAEGAARRRVSQPAAAESSAARAGYTRTPRA